MNINENITYQPDVINTLQSIPSIVWIVEGDVNIADNVTSIVGTYIVLGDGSTGSGQFNTGLSSTNSLIVYGSVLAKKFNLQRAYYDPNNPDIPAEQFVNDGRLQANPPPGLLDFSKAMPRFNMNP